MGVIGGGLAGLSAAYALGRRGFEVHLFEAAPHLGGKLGGWDVEALGRTFPLEHGFHGFFSHYYNVDALLEAAGAREDLRWAPSYPIAYAQQPDELFAPSTAPFPANLFSVIGRARSLSSTDFLGIYPGMLRMMAYDGRTTFAALDQISFASFLETSGIPESLRETVLVPFGNATMNHLDRLSAAEGIRFFHAYFFGNPESLAFRFLTRDVMTSVIGRIERLLAENGVQLHVGSPVARIEHDGRRVLGLRLEGAEAEGGSARPRVVVSVDAVRDTWTSVTLDSGFPLFHRRDPDGGLRVLHGRCTHMGCPVHPRPDGAGFLCPCHGGAFDEAGKVVSGPPERPLQAWQAVPVDGGFALEGPAVTATETIPFDYVVLACDGARGAKLVEASDFPEDQVWARRVRALTTADPYAVLRLWFDRPVDPSREPFYTVHQYPYTDSLAIYSRFQEPFIAWARETGGSVVETHAYAIEGSASYDAVQAALVRETRMLLPELRQAKVLHAEMQYQSNFTSFAPGRYAERPETRTGLENLTCAGDWVRLPVPAFLMEAAVLSGRMAANAFMESEGLETDPLPHVAPTGPLA